MNNSNRSNSQGIQRQFLMQDMQINAFAEASKIAAEKLAELQKSSTK